MTIGLYWYIGNLDICITCLFWMFLAIWYVGYLGNLVILLFGYTAIWPMGYLAIWV